VQPNIPAAAAGSGGRVGAADGLSVGVPSNSQDGPRAVSPGGSADWPWLSNKSLSLLHCAWAVVCALELDICLQEHTMQLRGCCVQHSQISSPTDTERA
jgi:hypothetical protein